MRMSILIHNVFMDELMARGYMRFPIREAIAGEPTKTIDVEIFTDIGKCSVGDWTPCSEVFLGVMIQGADGINMNRIPDIDPLVNDNEKFDDNKMLFETVKVTFPDGETETFMKRTR